MGELSQPTPPCQALKSVISALNKHNSALRDDNQQIGQMCEIMGFLIQPKRPPEPAIRVFPPTLKAQNALKPVNQAMNDEINQRQPP
jgi:septal ring factor EnvC (AmiA/AmiB activator)